jgi:hypothetical protein
VRVRARSSAAGRSAAASSGRAPPPATSTSSLNFKPSYLPSAHFCHCIALPTAAARSNNRDPFPHFHRKTTKAKKGNDKGKASGGGGGGGGGGDSDEEEDGAISYMGVCQLTPRHMHRRIDIKVTVVACHSRGVSSVATHGNSGCLSWSHSRSVSSAAAG